jgi:hypothetical protein
MRPPIIGTALPIAGVILIVWAATVGQPTDTWFDWAVRATVTYPPVHLAVRAWHYRHRQH